jgi:hypothetical protein
MKARRNAHASADPVRDLETVALLDATLGSASQREFFTHDEAVQLLRHVQASIHDVTLTARITSTVNDAIVSIREDRLVDADRVSDALLDIRLALTRAPAVDELRELDEAVTV